MKYLLFTIAILISGAVFSQNENEKLAAHYFAEKEYQKAADVYQGLVKKEIGSFYLYDNYLICLFELKDFKTAEKLVKKKMKTFPKLFSYKVDEGYIQEKKGEQNKADNIYKNLIKDIAPEEERIGDLAKAFEKRFKNDYALKAYERGRKVLEDRGAFTMEIATLYLQLNQMDKVFDEYLYLLEENEGYLKEIKSQVSSFSTSNDFALLQNKLVERISKNSSSLALNDLLMWTFIQQKNWESAFIQTRAIDKRLKEDGERMLDMAEIYKSNYEYKWASKAYKYIVEKGEKSYFYEDAKVGLLDNRFRQMVQEGYLPEEELNALEKDFIEYIGDNIYTPRSISIQRKLAKLYAYYKKDTKSAIEILEKTTSITSINQRVKAEAKLELADIYLISGDVWEPALLYSQVEKDFVEEALGQEAKFKNARLAYFRGEFEWAQTQLEVLKAATTQLISNNAIQLSLFIQDNMGMDSTEQPMILYSQAELLIFQNNFEEAEQELEAISILFPNHTLEDEILFALGKMSEKQRKWEEAIAYYSKVVENHSQDILADNALFRIGDIYQFKLKNSAKANEYYEKLILDYNSSMFVVEARKRYRSIKNMSKEERFIKGIE